MTTREVKSRELIKKEEQRARANAYAREYNRRLREQANSGDEKALTIIHNRYRRASERNDTSRKNAVRHYKEWSYEELQYLEHNRFNKTAPEMAEELGRTINSVYSAIQRYYVCGDYDVEITINSINTGKRIQKYMANRRLTVSDVASKMGTVSTAAVSQWITGKTVPTVDNLFRLAHVLHVNVSSIIVKDVHKRNVTEQV